MYDRIGDQNSREIIHWCNDLVNQVFPGLGLTGRLRSWPAGHTQDSDYGNVYLLVTTTSDQLATVNRLARATTADPDTTSQAHIDIMGEELNNPDNLTRIVVQMILNSIIEVMVPRHALQKVKRYLRREYRKPASMRVRDYFQRLVFINQQELPRLPPFGNDQCFTQSDMIDILLFATPKIWQKDGSNGIRPSYQHGHRATCFHGNCEAMESYEKDDKTSLRNPTTPRLEPKG